MEELTDNEREEQLRRWWSDNWLWIFGGIALGLAALAGWQYWQNQRISASEAAAAGYRQVIESLGRDDRPQAILAAEQLRKTHPEAPYADQAELVLARVAVERREYDEAARLLNGVIDVTRDSDLRMIARERLARVMIEQGKPDEALALLDASQAGAYAAIYHDVRGDALARKGDPEAARAEFELAISLMQEDSGLDRRYVELKRDALTAPAAPGDAER